MFSRILVPTDFSAPSDAALAYARGLAGTFDATLHLLHVLENEFLRPVVADPQALETAALRHLQKRLTDDDRRRFHAIPAIERSDAPADEIVSYARTQDIDLIVMGTHGRSGMAHLLVGSVAEKVVRAAPCPVLTLREAPPAARRANAGITRILVPTDFSPPSAAALGCARLVAARFGASLCLLHVLEDAVVARSIGSEVYFAESPGIRTARLRDAQERLAHRVAPHDRAQFRATTEVIFGFSARTIVEYAADNEYDLIVMGTHGRTGVAHLLMGSVAESVVRSTSCPVLTVREARERVAQGDVERRAIGATA
jgi:nucleotide-binding universal stress UspA family protein